MVYPVAQSRDVQGSPVFVSQSHPPLENMAHMVHSRAPCGTPAAPVIKMNSSRPAPFVGTFVSAWCKMACQAFIMCVDCPTSSQWLQMSWCQIGVRPSATNMLSHQDGIACLTFVFLLYYYMEHCCLIGLCYNFKILRHEYDSYLLKKNFKCNENCYILLKLHWNLCSKV